MARVPVKRKKATKKRSKKPLSESDFSVRLEVKKTSNAERSTRVATRRSLKRDNADTLSELNQEASPLLRLPREVRDMIYDFAIGGNEIEMKYMPKQMHDFELDDGEKASDLFENCLVYTAGTYGARSGYAHKSVKKYRDLFSLAESCRQLRAETSLLVFSLNVFLIPPVSFFDDFLRKLNADQIKAIKTVAVGPRAENSMEYDGSLNYHMGSYYGFWRRCSTTAEEFHYKNRCAKAAGWVDKTLDKLIGLQMLVKLPTANEAELTALEKYAETRGLPLKKDLVRGRLPLWEAKDHSKWHWLRWRYSKLTAEEVFQ